MTWSLAHTVEYTGSASFDVAYTYLFDTLLPTKGWTVTGGNDAFSRFATTTVKSAWDNTDITIGWFADWIQVGEDELDMYWDPVMDGVTIPDFTYKGATWSGGAFGTIQFWTSDSNDGVLVTSKRRLLFFWPGTQTRWWNYGSTTPSIASGTGSIYPWTGEYWYHRGAPVSTSSTGLAYVGVNTAQSDGYARPGLEYAILSQGASQVGQSSTSTTSDPKGPILNIVSDDVYSVQSNVGGGPFYPIVRTSSSQMYNLFDGSKYYLGTQAAASSYGQYWFDFGSTMAPLRN